MAVCSIVVTIAQGPPLAVIHHHWYCFCLVEWQLFIVGGTCSLHHQCSVVVKHISEVLLHDCHLFCINLRLT